MTQVTLGPAVLDCSARNLVVSAAPDTQDWSGLLRDGSGGAIVVYSNSGPGGRDIRAKHILACGTLDPSWPADGVILGGTRAWWPTLVTDGAGGAFVVWNDGAISVNSAGIVTVGANVDILAQHLRSNGTVDPAWPAGGTGVCTAPGVQDLPRITSDGSGGALVTWDDRRDGAASRHVFVHHLLNTGLDPAWPANGMRVCPTFNSQLFPELCSDGAGGAIVAWSETRAPTGRDIFAQHVTASGAILWATNGVPVTQAFGRQQFVTAPGGTYVYSFTDDEGQPMVPDGAGGCFLTWEDTRTGNVNNEDVYAQHLTSAGAVASGWPANGAAVCTDGNDQQASIILADGAGGAIVSWVDTRPAVYAQHLSSAGVADGPVNGLAVSTAATTFSLMNLVHDGSTGAILFWGDQRRDDADAFAHHLLVSGGLSVDPAWPVNGLTVSAANGYQYPVGNACIAPDDAGGALTSWPDTRNTVLTGPPDLYAQKVTAAGTLPTFSLTGQVLASCPSPNTGLLGITVDAYEVGTGDLVGSAVTSASGSYSIPGLCWGGDYTLTAVTPLDYVAAAAELPGDGCSGAVNFGLSCIAANGTPQSMGFWKHEVGVATGGNGHGQIDAATLCGYLDLIAVHFNSNAINQVIVYQPPASGQCADKLEVAKALLNLQGSVAMIYRAKQQLMSLLLNVAAGYISQTRVISADGATVSQAITYADNVIDSPTGNYERAKSICDDINNGVVVPAGWIPLSTQQIAYGRGGKVLEFRVTPNPGPGPLKFEFALRHAGSVDLSVYDVHGRLAARLVSGPLGAGPHSVTWGAGAAGSRTAEGVYFARLTTPEGVSALRVLKL